MRGEIVQRTFSIISNKKVVMMSAETAKTIIMPMDADIISTDCSVNMSYTLIAQGFSKENPCATIRT